MLSRTRYQLKQHHKFEKDDQKYVADLEIGDIVQIDDVEWEILSRYESQTHHQIVEVLKKEYKLAAIFDGIERLERLGKTGFTSASSGRERRGFLLGCFFKGTSPLHRSKPKLLVPFHFTKEKSALDYVTNLTAISL